MSPLLENAVQSLKVGVEDYLSNNPGRTHSATRNITAGILLLLKEKLRQLSPAESNEVLLKQKVSPKLEEGRLVFEGSGNKTIGVHDIKERLNSLGIRVNWKRLDDIVKIRNNIEHYFTKEATSQLREVIADAVLLIREFSDRHLNISPVELLGDQTWRDLLDTAEVYSKELKECQDERAKIQWSNKTLTRAAKHLRCLNCGSELLKPLETSCQNWYSLSFACSPCGKISEFEELVESALESALEEHFGIDMHNFIKDGGEYPYEECPQCARDTYLMEDAMCAACGYELDYSECQVCGESLSVDEQEFGGLCGYHHYVTEQERDR